MKTTLIAMMMFLCVGVQAQRLVMQTKVRIDSVLTPQKTLYDRLILPAEEAYLRKVYGEWMTALNAKLPTYTRGQLAAIVAGTRTSDIAYLMSFEKASLPQGVWQKIKALDERIRNRILAAPSAVRAATAGSY